MQKPERIGDIEIAQDIKFQERMWTVERVGWYLILLFLTAAFLGFFGPGFFSKSEAKSSNGSMSVEYLRFDRNQAPTHLMLTMGGELSDEEGKLLLRVNREYIESIEISHIDPQPSKVTAGSRDVTFEFNLEKNRPAHIKIYYEFQEPGSHSLNLRAGNEAVINVNQFVYP